MKMSYCEMFCTKLHQQYFYIFPWCEIFFFMHPSVIKFIVSETSFPEGTDPAVLPEKPLQEKETALLERFAPVLQKFVHESINLQLSALYALQTQCYNLSFPKGTFHDTVEPHYNEVLGTMKIALLYQVSHYIRVKKQRTIKSWDQQNYLVIRGFCYIRPLYNEVPLYSQLCLSRISGDLTNHFDLDKIWVTVLYTFVCLG